MAIYGSDHFCYHHVKLDGADQNSSREMVVVLVDG
jgi:hypothetical protein